MSPWSASILLDLLPAAIGAAGAWWLDARPGEKTPLQAVIYRPRQDALPLILGFAVFFPLVVLTLPDAVVLDVRPMFDLGGGLASLSLFWSWVYFRRYRIVLIGERLAFGAFFMTPVDLSRVTRVRYHQVNDGVSLKLFAGKTQVAIFENSVAPFDAFAQDVRRRLPPDVIAETVGQARFAPTP